MIPRYRADQWSWFVLGVCYASIVYSLWMFWGLEPAYADRFLIIVGSGYAFWTLLPSARSLSPSPRLGLGLPILLFGGIAYSLALFLFFQTGPRTLLLWWLLGAWVFAAVGLGLSRYGIRTVTVMLFPLVFLFFALPVPTRIMVPLQDFLQGVTTKVAYHSFSILGFTVKQTEFVLSLPSGMLRVEEACSGVRSLTALTAIAAFVGYLKQFSLLRGLILFCCSIPIVIAVNVLRVILSGLIQESVGREYIQGFWHELLGFAMVFVGLGIILSVASWLTHAGQTKANNASKGAHDSNAASIDVTPPTVDLAFRGAVPTAVVATLILCLCIVAALAGQGVTNLGIQQAPLADVARTYPGWTSEECEVATVVNEQLRPDLVIHRRYINNIGQDAYVWLFYWRSGSKIIGYHHPDVCWGNRGLIATERWIEYVRVGSSESSNSEDSKQAVVAITAREFKDAKPPQLVYYWTQEGNYIWNDTDEEAAKKEMLSSSWHGQKWVGDLLGARPEQQGARLQVMIITPDAGPLARKNANQLAAFVAEDLYRLCPWARPPAEAKRNTANVGN